MKRRSHSTEIGLAAHDLRALEFWLRRHNVGTECWVEAHAEMVGWKKWEGRWTILYAGPFGPTGPLSGQGWQTRLRCRRLLPQLIRALGDVARAGLKQLEGLE